MHVKETVPRKPAVAELERRLAETNPKKDPSWRQESERSVPQFELITDNKPEDEACHAFRVQFGKAIRNARRNGQFSVQVRLIVADRAEGDSLHVHAFLATLRGLLKEQGAIAETGAILGKMTEAGRISYIPLTISW